MASNSHRTAPPQVFCGGRSGGKLSVLLCDDNAIFLQALCGKVQAILESQGLELRLHAYTAGDEIPESVKADAQLIFLDIGFDGEGFSGMDLARDIRSRNGDGVLFFVTNYLQFAPEGYEVSAFRYLLKDDMDAKLQPYLLQGLERLKELGKTLQIRVAGEEIVLPLKEVQYLESQGHTVVMYGRKEKWTFYSTLTHMEQQLLTFGFLRVQKSFLVNMRHIRSFGREGLALMSGEVLPVSKKTYLENKKTWLLWRGR